MKKKLFVLLVAVVFLSACTTRNDLDWPLPTIESKPWTRWWWLGSAVDSCNLTYNIAELGRAGIGGVEITPIYGVKGLEKKYIDFLSSRWMKMLSYTEKEAAAFDMKVDMNMGTGWPFGGPEISLSDAASKAFFREYRVAGGKEIQLNIAIEDTQQKSIAALSRLMAYSTKGDKIDLTKRVTGERNLRWNVPSGEWRLIALFVGKTLQKVKRAAPGGEGYVIDYLNADAMRRYFKKFDEAFVRTQTPFPNGFFNDSYEVYGADWTPSFLEEFRERRGYKLEDYFPELLAKDYTDISVRVVSDYRQTLGEMLLDNFSTQWVNWAKLRGVTTRNQAHGSPGNLIDLYGSVDIPECEIFGVSDFDIPGLRKDSLIRKNDGDPVTLKFASSAAHITGRNFTSAETFTWLTEHFRTSLSQCKPEIDQMFTSGVNRVYFHGTPYSPKEAPWPGWLFYASMNMSPTNSIWRDAPAFFSYITRIQSFLQYGQPDNDVLAYFPIYDAWNEQHDHFYLPFFIHSLRERFPRFYQAIDQIKSNGYDVDYISDAFLQTVTVEDGSIKTSGGSIYKALVMPAVRFIPVKTIYKLYDLASQGACIIFADNYPCDVPGLSDFRQRKSELAAILDKFPQVDFGKTSVNALGKGKIVTGRNYRELFAVSGIVDEKFVTDFKGQCIRRKNRSGHHYFMSMLTNCRLDNWVRIAVPAKSAMFFDPMTGVSGKAKTREIDGTTEVYMQLMPGESIILKTFAHNEVKTRDWKYVESTGEEILLEKEWKLAFTQSEPTINDIFHIDTLGFWSDISDEITARNMGTGRYSTTFAIDDLNSDEYLLELGDVRESARVFVNRKEVATLFAVPFRTYIGKYLKKGNNTLEIEVTNLPANRIADYDRRGVEWRIFNDINFIDVKGRRDLFDKWKTIPSGLQGPVAVKAIRFKQ